jgi:hypothetical protein
VLSALLIVLFLVRGLQRIYPVFFSSWIFDLLIWTLPFLLSDLPTQTTAEAVCMVIRWIFYFLMVMELIDRILEDHPGIARLGRRVVQVVMVLAAAAAISTLRFATVAKSGLGERARLVLQSEQLVTGCLLVFLVAINAFLWFFPVRLNRNTKAYCFGFTAFFLFKASAPFLLNTKGADYLDEANTIYVGGLMICQLIWLFAITRRGAELTPAFPRSWTPVEQQKALASLGALEQEISKSRAR